MLLGLQRHDRKESSALGERGVEQAHSNHVSALPEFNTDKGNHSIKNITGEPGKMAQWVEGR